VYTVQYSTARVCHLNASLTKAPRFSQKALSPRIADSKCSQTPLPPTTFTAEWGRILLLEIGGLGGGTTHPRIALAYL
jgi:hypothetical protein